MDMKSLEERLLVECFNTKHFHIGAKWWRRHDALCLTKHWGRYEVFHGQDGDKIQPVTRFKSQEEACEFFYREMCADEKYQAHTVGLFLTKRSADHLEEFLQSLEITRIEHEHVEGEFPFHVTVYGSDVLKAVKAYQFIQDGKFLPAE